MSKPWYAAFTEDGSRWTAGPESLNDALDRAAFFETLGKGRVSFGQTKPGGARTLPFVMPIENVRRLLVQGGHKPPSQGGYQNLKSYRKRNPSRERGAEIAHALFGGPKRKVTKRFLKDEKVGWNGFAVKIVKYGKDQTCIIGTGVSERCVPTSSIEDIPSHEWNSRWDKQWNGKKANPKRNPSAHKVGQRVSVKLPNGKRKVGTIFATVTQAGMHLGCGGESKAGQTAHAIEFRPGGGGQWWPESCLKPVRAASKKVNPSGDEATRWRERGGYEVRAFVQGASAPVRVWSGFDTLPEAHKFQERQKEWAKREGYTHTFEVHHVSRQENPSRARGAEKNPSSHIGDIIRVRHTPSADAPAVYTPFENNYRVLDVSNDPSRARRPIKVASTTNKHGKKGAVSWISVDQIVKVVRRAK